MKPVIIYGLPRTRSSAALQACRRGRVISDITQSLAQVGGSWTELLSRISDANTVTRIRGHDLDMYPELRAFWYSDIMDQDRYDLFVIERQDRRAAFISWILAREFGFHSFESVEPYEFAADPATVDNYALQIQAYLNHWPAHGLVVRFESLPQTHFDPFFITMFDQRSHEKYVYISNLDWLRTRVDEILLEYRTPWDQRIGDLGGIS